MMIGYLCQNDLLFKVNGKKGTCSDIPIPCNSDSYNYRTRERYLNDLFLAAIRDRCNEIQEVVTHNPLLNVNDPCRRITKMNALHVAARWGSFRAVAQLMEFGARSDIRYLQ